MRFKKSKSTVSISLKFTLPLIKKEIVFQYVALFFIVALSFIGFRTLLFANSFPKTSITFEPIMNQFLPKKVFASSPPSLKGKLISYGSREKKEVALTFDADMTYGMEQMLSSGEVESFYDQKLIDVLQETGTKATLFLSGLWIETYPEVARELAGDPLFELANHSYSHPSFSGDCYGLRQISEEDKYNEIEKTQELLKGLTHSDNKLFRFPGGCYSAKDLALLKTFGLTAVEWDTVGNDGFNDNADAILFNVLNKVHNGSIIVLHMNGYPNEPKTAQVLPTIISTLKEQGFSFVTVSELLFSQHASQVFSIRQLLQYNIL